MLMRKTAPTSVSVPVIENGRVEELNVPLMAASDIPAPMSIDEPAHIDADPKKSELEEAQSALGIGGRIEIHEKEFVVVTSKPTRHGHGQTIEAALYDLANPGKLQPTVGNA